MEQSSNKLRLMPVHPIAAILRPVFNELLGDQWFSVMYDDPNSEYGEILLTYIMEIRDQHS